MSRWRSRLLDASVAASAACAVVLTLLAFQGRFSRTPFTIDREPQLLDQWETLVSQGHRSGPDNALVTILEFGDYECPACRRFHTLVGEFMESHPADVALVYRHWPLSNHRYAYAAARAAECAAAQNVFWAFHDKLFEDPDWIGDAFTRFAAESGIRDLPAFRTCTKVDDPVPTIEADIDAVEELDPFGTPTVAVNGVLYGTPPRLADLESILEDARSAKK